MRKILAVLAFLLPLPTSAASADRILLKCLPTPEYTVPGANQRWFVTMPDYQVGSVISVKQVQDSGEHDSQYEIAQWTDDVFVGYRLKEEGKLNTEEMITIDRVTGRMTLTHLVKHEDTHTLWNEQRERLGGFTGDTWFGTVFDCVPSDKIF